MKDSFISVASEAEAIYKEKGSEFIARVYPVAAESECGDILSLVRKEYHDATHHTYAYRLADDTVRYSDDGEPSGTAGPRILNAIEKHDLYNVIVIVVRYFGGIKLGTGRLGKAYSTAANEVIAVCKKVERTAYRAARLTVAHSETSSVYHLFSLHRVKDQKADFTNENVCFTFHIALSQIDEFQKECKQMLAYRTSLSFKDTVKYF